MKFRGTFKTLTSLGRVLLVQLGASQCVEGFRTVCVVAKRKMEEGFGLLEVTSLKKHGAVGEIVAAKLEGLADARKRQRPRQPLGVIFRYVAEVFLDTLRV